MMHGQPSIKIPDFITKKSLPALVPERKLIFRLTVLQKQCLPQLFSNLVIIYLLAYEDGRDRVFRNVGI